jgi:hypothetical protein
MKTNKNNRSRKSKKIYKESRKIKRSKRIKSKKVYKIKGGAGDILISLLKRRTKCVKKAVKGFFWSNESCDDIDSEILKQLNELYSYGNNAYGTINPILLNNIKTQLFGIEVKIPSTNTQLKQLITSIETSQTSKKSQITKPLLVNNDNPDHDGIHIRIADVTTTIKKISGPCSFYYLKPNIVKAEGIDFPLIMLFGDIHQSRDNMCTPCNNNPDGCYQIYDTSFLQLLDTLSLSKKPVDIYFEMFAIKSSYENNTDKYTDHPEIIDNTEITKQLDYIHAEIQKKEAEKAILKEEATHLQNSILDINKLAELKSHFNLLYAEQTVLENTKETLFNSLDEKQNLNNQNPLHYYQNIYGHSCFSHIKRDLLTKKEGYKECPTTNIRWQYGDIRFCDNNCIEGEIENYCVKYLQNKSTEPFKDEFEINFSKLVNKFLDDLNSNNDKQSIIFEFSVNLFNNFLINKNNSLIRKQIDKQKNLHLNDINTWIKIYASSLVNHYINNLNNLKVFIFLLSLYIPSVLLDIYTILRMMKTNKENIQPTLCMCYFGNNHIINMNRIFKSIGYTIDCQIEKTDPINRCLEITKSINLSDDVEEHNKMRDLPL